MSNLLIGGKIKPEPILTFHNENTQRVGELTWEDGVFKFKGKAEESAKIFLDWLRKRPSHS